MATLGVVLVSVAPGLFWLWFFLRYDKFRPAPRRLVAITFGLGCLSTAPALVLNSLFVSDSIFEESAPLVSVAFTMLAVVGPVEELSKFAAVRVGAFRSRYFDEPLDGLVYAAAAALGFATVENLLYVYQFGPAVMIGRAPLSTLAHVIFASFWGYGLARHLRSGRRRTPVILVGLVVAALVHALFNITVFVFPLAAIAIVVVGGLWVGSRFRWAGRASRFVLKRNVPMVECAVCQSLVRSGSQFCRFCGAAGPDHGSHLICGNCRASNREDARFCVSCGDRFVTG